MKTKTSYREKLQALEIHRTDERLSKGKKKKKVKKLKKKVRQKKKPEYLTKYHNYLQSSEWVEIRIAMLQYYDYTCARCGIKYKHYNLHVHHKTYKNIYNEQPDDLELICKQCHNKEHSIIK